MLFLVIAILQFTGSWCESGPNYAPRWVEDLQRVWLKGIPEETEAGSVLGRLSASDPEGDLVSYSVSFNDALAVDTTTGDVSLIRQLDREVERVIDVTFYAQDHHGSQTRAAFDIVVDDANDNTPTFLETPYSARAQEHLGIGSIIFPGLLARDHDIGLNAALEVSCLRDGSEESEVACDMFSVHATPIVGSTGFYRGSVTLKGHLDYEARRNFVMTIQVRDFGTPSLSSVVLLPITVEYMQDQPPAFINAPFSLSITENTPVGTSVGQVQARDTDLGSSSRIQMSIFEDDLGYFSLSEPMRNEDGSYYASILLAMSPDWEEVPHGYSFHIHAFEDYNNGTFGDGVQTIATVTIEDVNDHMPLFDQKKYQVDVPEDLQEGDVLPQLTISVYDMDSDANSRLELHIIGRDADKFELVPSRVFGRELVTLRVNDPSVLDYENEENRMRTLIIEAIEVDTQERYSTQAVIELSLYDTNDNEPEFHKESYEVEIPENLPFGAHIITITASDRDTGSNALILYELEGEDSDCFRVDMYSGDISLACQVDPKKRRRLEVTLVARDNHGAHVTANVDVSIMETLRVMTAVTYLHPVQPSVTVGAAMLNQTVQISETGHVSGMTYYIVSGNTASNSFQVNNNTGELEVLHAITLQDYAMAPNGAYTLKINITDISQQVTTVYMMVHVILDIQSYSSGYRVVIPETTSPNTEVINLRSIMGGLDAEYTVTSETSMFYATGGSIRTQFPFIDQARDEPYLLSVNVKDFSTGSLITNTTVSVYVFSSDSSAQEQVIFLSPSTSSRTVYGVEGQQAGRMIAQLSAYEARSASSSGITYSLMNVQNYAQFSVDGSTGILTNNVVLDRETLQSYDITVRAQSSNTFTEMSMEVLLVDIDDNEPSFDNCETSYTNPITEMIQDGAIAGTLVTTVSACDADDTPIIYYYIVCGNQPSVATSSLIPFSVDKMTGALTTQTALNHDQQAEFNLCIKATSDPSYTMVPGQTFDSVVNDRTVMRYTVTVSDVSYSVPSFGYQNATFVAAVQAEATFHAEVIRIQAYDADSDAIRYKLQDMRFYSYDGTYAAADRTFTIDEVTGMVYTNMIHYLDFNSGYFLMEIIASSSSGTATTSSLIVYLIRSGQLMRFVFQTGNEPEQVLSSQAVFTSEVSNTVGAHVSASSLRYHVTDEGEINFDRTDMCFHVVNSTTSRVLEPSAVYDLFRNKFSQLLSIYGFYKVDSDFTGTVAGVDRCDVRVTTVWWSGYWYLWWLLIALALLLILLAIICMICLAMKYKDTRDQLPYKPYTILDPYVIPYEYEETTVHM